MTKKTGSLLVSKYPALLSVPELAAYLSIKTKTLYAKIEAGEIPHYRIGRLVRFRLDEINAWLEGCRKDSSLISNKHKGKVSRTRLKLNDQISTLIAKTIDEEQEKYYISDHGKSDRIEDLRREVNNGTF